MGETSFRLAPPRQVRVAGVSIGVLAIRPDPAHPLALLGVFNPDTREPESHRVRPGDELAVGGLTVHVGEVVPGDDRHVDVVVSWPDEEP